MFSRCSSRVHQRDVRGPGVGRRAACRCRGSRRPPRTGRWRRRRSCRGSGGGTGRSRAACAPRRSRGRRAADPTRAAPGAGRSARRSSGSPAGAQINEGRGAASSGREQRSCASPTRRRCRSATRPSSRPSAMRRSSRSRSLVDLDDVACGAEGNSVRNVSCVTERMGAAVGRRRASSRGRRA